MSRRTEVRTAEHAAVVRAPADLVHGLLAATAGWPAVFPSFVHTRDLGPGPAGSRRVGMWTASDGAVHPWVALCTRHPAERRVDFRPEVLPPGLDDLVRSWLVEARTEHGSVVRLRHRYRPATTDADAVSELERQIESIATAEVGACVEAAEQRAGRPELLLVLRDRAAVRGPVGDAYAFLRDVKGWAAHVPHVAAVSVAGPDPDAGTAEVDVLGPRGVVRTRVARVCLAPDTVVQKQLLLPPLARLHRTVWSLRATATGTEVATEHQVLLAPEGIAAVLGAGAGVADAEAFVRQEVGGKGQALVEALRRVVEAHGVR